MLLNVVGIITGIGSFAMRLKGKVGPLTYIELLGIIFIYIEVLGIMRGLNACI